MPKAKASKSRIEKVNALVHVVAVRSPQDSAFQQFVIQAVPKVDRASGRLVKIRFPGDLLINGDNAIAERASSPIKDERRERSHYRAASKKYGGSDQFANELNAQLQAYFSIPDVELPMLILVSTANFGHKVRVSLANIDFGSLTIRDTVSSEICLAFSEKSLKRGDKTISVDLIANELISKLDALRQPTRGQAKTHHDHLDDMIVDLLGKQPDMRMLGADIAARLKLNPSTIRKNLSRLSKSGTIHHLSRKGYSKNAIE